ncbi:MAG: general secretion pathway protein GspB [Pseudomonadota bacterium]
MSLILDALRKSDDQHAEHRAPTVAGAQGSPQPTTTPRWLWPVVALLAVNAIVLVWVLMRTTEAPTDAATRAIETTAAAAAEPASATRTTNNVPVERAAVRSLLAETIDEAREQRRTATPDIPPTEGEIDSTDATKVASDTVPASGPAPATNTPIEPRTPVYDPINATQQLQWPLLSMELHVFSSDPGGRFGFINGQKVVEGSTLSEGPRVLEVTRQGIILEYRAKRLLLTP